nr:hypothetical protein JVH1_4629 [Rhodococcus sp. JVH1]
MVSASAGSLCIPGSYAFDPLEETNRTATVSHVTVCPVGP